MELALDIPWPWSLSPVEAMYRLTFGVLPGFLCRSVIAALVGSLAVPLSRQRGVITAILASLLGLLGFMLARQPMPALAALLIVWCTVATYRGSPKAGTLKILVVVGLRLLALLLLFLTILRPALVVRTENKVPSVAILALDVSQSMTYKDEFNNQTRFEAMRNTLRRCEPILDQLQQESQITVNILAFAGETVDWKPDLTPDGRTSDYGNLLTVAQQRFGNEANLRGLIIVGDGADNGRRFNAIAEARKWKSIQCPIQCFGVGSANVPSQPKDLILAALNVEPSPVFVKGRMIFKATVDAFGCESGPVTPRIYIDGKEAPIEKISVNGVPVAPDECKCPLSAGNELRVETTAPETPGEVRVTMRLAPVAGEITVNNNEISTYVTVSKEGVSVLLVAPLDEETKYIRQVLMSDPRIRLFETTRQTDAPPRGGEAELFQFERQAYDVIILRNVSRKRLSAGNPQVLTKIYDLVNQKGVGFMMMGGFDSFGGTPGLDGSGDWVGSPIANLLPVQLNVQGHADGNTRFFPTRDGVQHYLVQMDALPENTRRSWDRLNTAIQMRGINKLGDAKPGAQVLARTEDNDQGMPIMVAQSVGRGRSLAFAGDTTYLWRILGLPDSTDGIDLHARFWKQTVLWLAQQENSEGSVWVKPDFRRLPAGAQQAFSVGVRGKTGLDLPGGKYDTRVFGPNNQAFPVPVRREGQFDRGQFWQTLQPGEYRIEVNGAAMDVDQKPVTGKASVRFIVYQDERELLQPAADMDFLGKLAAAGGGRAQAYRIDDLPDFLAKLKSASLPNQKVKLDRYPDWRRSTLGPFLPFWLILFTAVLCLEWGLRRIWGMV